MAFPPLRAAGSGITELGRDVRQKVGCEKTSVTKIPETGRKRLHHGGTEDTEKE
jgi:hypothetical protein